MQFKTLSLLGSVALLAAPLTTARAQYNFGNHSDVCGGAGFNFTFCVAVSAAQGTGADAANFFITIINEGLHGSNAGPYANLSITQLGFDGYTAAPIISAASSGTSFSPDNNITPLSNFAGTWVGGSADAPTVASGLLFHEFITFKFENTTVATFHNSDLAMHAQAGPGDCSSKMEIDLSHAAPGNGPDFVVGDCGVVTASPEPTSVALMATGLFGVLGVARRRRQS